MKLVPPRFTFYLGTHVVNWLWKVPVPLFVSHRTLRLRKSLYPALTRWALDSGGFSELNLFGEWTITPKQYVRAVRRYQSEIGKMQWAAIQDYMCEPHMVKKTGLSVRKHQTLTVDSYRRLMDLDSSIPWIPVLQGWTLSDYLRHVELYYAHGIDLTEFKTVGVGSVCKRQHTRETFELIGAIEELGISIHAFGFKKTGLPNTKHLLSSADSLAWSFQARKVGVPLMGCTVHKNCANCLLWALKWRKDLLRRLQ